MFGPNRRTVNAEPMSTIVISEPDFDLTAAPPSRLHVVLVNPEIPQNTGSVARLCAGARAWLHLVEPLGFVLSDRYLKRAGLDYWPGVRLSVHPSLEALEAVLPLERTWAFTKQAEQLHTDVRYPDGAVLVFGRETRGLDQAFVERHAERLVRIPTSSEIRSLNLANSVAVGVYEVLRQQGWRGETPMPS